MQTTYVFLHGSFHAAWNWHRVAPLFEAAGHRVIALDLPGHGLDTTPPHRCSLEANVNAVVRTIDGIDGPIVLVAHSRNGIVISQTAERVPERIAALVYVAAYLVPNGKSMMDYAALDQGSLVVQNVSPKTPRAQMRKFMQFFRKPWAQRWLPRLLPASRQTHRLVREAYREALYHDCDPEITELANALLQPEPNWAGFTPLRLSESRYGSVRKIYLLCTEDRAVTPALQRRMLKDSRCDEVIELKSGHSPFFSMPAEFSESILAATDTTTRTVTGSD